MEIIRVSAKQKEKVKVAAYCRVSTTRDEQEESLSVQMQAYKSLISTRSDWEFVGVYSDSISGLSAEKRPEFMRMINDAMERKIDRILCKSISRFSRNVAECKEFTDMLLTKNVVVEFEKENIRTDDPTSSLMFSLLSATAESESRSISENVRWGYRERYKRGEYNLGNNRILGYDSVDGKLVPNDDAWIVKMIFKLYAEGESMGIISNKLVEKGVLTKKGTPFSRGRIQYMLRNETYRGDKLLGKSPPRDLITKKKIPGEERVQKYLIDDHEAIVDEKTWLAVQQRIQQNAELTKTVGHLVSRSHFLYGKIFCADCGNPMRRRTFSSYMGEKYKVWLCRDRLNGKKGNGCKMRIVKEEDLLADVCVHMDWISFNQELFLDMVKRVLVHENGIGIERK